VSRCMLIYVLSCLSTAISRHESQLVVDYWDFVAALSQLHGPTRIRTKTSGFGATKVKPGSRRGSKE
jgi:hypothetical protein